MKLQVNTIQYCLRLDKDICKIDIIIIENADFQINMVTESFKNFIIKLKC